MNDNLLQDFEIKFYNTMQKFKKILICKIAAIAVPFLLIILLLSLILYPFGNISYSDLISINRETKIAVFNSSIAPGSSGVFDFIVVNPHSEEISCTCEIIAYYNDEEALDFPIRYRLSMNNDYVSSKAWQLPEKLQTSNFTLLPNSINRFVLEWAWFYESGNNTLDTALGSNSGEYYITILVSTSPN